MSQQLRESVATAFRQSQNLARVGGEYVCCTIDFQLSRAEIEVARVRASQFVEACLKQRLRVQLSGPNQTRAVLLPPLTTSGEELRQACERIKLALRL